MLRIRLIGSVEEVNRMKEHFMSYKNIKVLDVSRLYGCHENSNYSRVYLSVDITKK